MMQRHRVTGSGALSFIPHGQNPVDRKLFIEMAPGHVSTHLVAELLPGVRAVSITVQDLRYSVPSW